MKRDADNLIPAGDKWKFDGEVTKVFEAMLENSIPGYHDMRRLVTDLSRKFVRSDGVIVDLGASRGDALVPLIRHNPSVRCIAVEVSEPMRAVMRERFAGDRVTILDHDLRTNHGALEQPTDLVLSVLTLMFIPIEHRYNLLASIYKSLRAGGALILVEKVLGDGPVLDGLLTELYYEFKAANGYNQEAITRKRLSLEGVLVPVTFEWNKQMLRNTGFQHVECFWRSLNFCGFAAIK